MKLFAPLSLLWLALTGLVVGLQMIPSVGVFLMILAAPFWSVATINLAFIGIAAEALLFRWVSRGWLVLPALWFGGYYAWAAVDYAFLERPREPPRADMGVVAFDPARADLLITGVNARMAARAIMHDYDLPVVYSSSLRPGVPTHGAGSPVIAHRIAPLEACEVFRTSRVGLAQQDIAQENLFVHGARNAWCQYTMPEEPRRAVVTVPLDRQSTSSRYRPQSAPLAPLPMPVTGCGLNSNLLKWECFFAFARVPPKESGERGPRSGPADQLAARLGLERRRGIPASTEPSEALTRAIDTAVARAERDLERLLADPTVSLEGRAPLAPLEDRPDLVARHADRLVQTLERHWSNPEARSGLIRLSTLLPYLADSELERLAPRLRALDERSAAAPANVRFTSRLRARLGLRPPAP